MNYYVWTSMCKYQLALGRGHRYMWVEVLVSGNYTYTAVNLLFKSANLRTYRNEMFEDGF